MVKEEKDSKEADDDGLDRLVGQLAIFLPHLSHVSALGGPHRSCAQAQDDGPRDEGVGHWVELGGDVCGVAEHGKDHRPLDSQLFDEPCWHKHARQH